MHWIIFIKRPTRLEAFLAKITHADAHFLVFICTNDRAC